AVGACPRPGCAAAGVLRGRRASRRRVPPSSCSGAGVFRRPLSGGAGRISQKTGAGGNVGNAGFPGGLAGLAGVPGGIMAQASSFGDTRLPSSLETGVLTSLEICAGAGGQALGLEQAGFAHEAVGELDADACEPLRFNREWKVIEGDVANVDRRAVAHRDRLAGGGPRPPGSTAGQQLGSEDERDLCRQALRLVEEIGPRAVLLENVRGLGTRRFAGYRAQVLGRLRALGYDAWWDLVQASDHGVSQLRPRFVLVAMRPPWARWFRWPEPPA